MFAFADITAVICPGLANSSDSYYIRTFVEHAQNSGYRCCVLNHVGTPIDVPVTSPRIFSYGMPQALVRNTD